MGKRKWSTNSTGHQGGRKPTFYIHTHFAASHTALVSFLYFKRHTLCTLALSQITHFSLPLSNQKEQYRRTKFPYFLLASLPCKLSCSLLQFNGLQNDISNQVVMKWLNSISWYRRIEFIECLLGSDAMGYSYHFFRSSVTSKYDTWINLFFSSSPFQCYFKTEYTFLRAFLDFYFLSSFH